MIIMRYTVLELLGGAYRWVDLISKICPCIPGALSCFGVPFGLFFPISLFQDKANHHFKIIVILRYVHGKGF